MLFWVAKLKVNFVTESIQKMTTLEHVASDLYVMIIYYNQQTKKKQTNKKNSTLDYCTGQASTAYLLCHSNTAEVR